MKWMVAMLLLSSAAGADVGVRVIFGLGDLEAAKWDGSATVRGAEIKLVEPWRFEDGDTITGTSWHAVTHPIRLFGGANANQPKPPMVANGVILTLSDAAG